VQQPELLPDLIEQFHRALRRTLLGIGHPSNFLDFELTTANRWDTFNQRQDPPCVSCWFGAWRIVTGFRQKVKEI
jgi:hypothetical protein